MTTDKLKTIDIVLINKEIEPLKQKLFNGDMFKVFTDEELMSEDYKKYDRLIKLKMKFYNNKLK